MAGLNVAAEPVAPPRCNGNIARVLYHRSCVHIEVESLSQAATSAIERAIRVISAEVGDQADSRGPATTEMTVPPMSYGSVTLSTDGKPPREEAVIASCAMARALLRDAGFQV